MTAGDIALVAAAGLLAGGVNAIAGGGTLISFPALLAAGLPPVTANITSSVGLLSGYLGGSVAYREELAGQRARVRELGAASVLGGIAGAIILLVTPADAFKAVVPYLVLMSSGLLALQPALARRVAARRARAVAAASIDPTSPPARDATLERGAAEATPEAAPLGWPVRVLVGVAGLYGSYFGAGLGVLLLAVLGVLVADNLQRLNALKGVLSLIVNLVGVVVFLASGRVAWVAAAILLLTAYAGGTLGVRVARRLRPQALRLGVVTLGVVVGIVMLVR
jgi:uncharacterized membrane protein YfcA